MSRPLVIKVTSHDSQPRKKSTGSINVELLRANETQPNTDPHISNSLENLVTGSSLVRSLINKYESGNSPPVLVKYRSKSMVDLSHEQKPIPEKPTTQDDFLYLGVNQNEDGEVLQEWKHNFKQAMSKFQQLPKSTTAIHERANKIGDVRERAKQLLKATKHDYFWFNDVMDLLQHIVDGKESQQVLTINDMDLVKNDLLLQDENDVLDPHENEDAESLSHSEEHLSEPNSLENSKIDEMKQIYEDKIVHKTHVNTETSANDPIHIEKKTEKKLPLKYFGKDDEDDGESTAAETTDHLNEYTITQLSSSCNDNELLDSEMLDEDEVFEDHDNFETIDLNDEVEETENSFSSGNHEALLVVEDMLKKIEECDKKIDNITFENHAEANRLNEMLIQVLVKLDDLRTYEDGVIITMRNKAFSFTQDCIKKLKDKVFGDEQ